MTPVATARMTVRVSGLLMLVLGLIIWTGRADALIPVHMLVGIVLVVALLMLVYLGWATNVPSAPLVAAIAVIIVMPVLGLAQEGLLEGSAHWLVQILHLIVGLGAIGIGEVLAAQIERRETAPIGR